ncbi:MAG TPA: S41 family peptidase [Planctomycetota bacterium]|nr:S41 family peptidase [Planctomycetota bacterium]
MPATALRALLLVVVAAPLAAQSPYLDDFAFLQKTVAERAAVPAWKGVDWAAICAAFRPRFAACADDATHVALVMELLATLRDSHTGVTRTSVREGLPSKFDGLYGGGLGFAFDDGKWVLAGAAPGVTVLEQAPAGSMLHAIDGEPAFVALERERRRIVKHLGVSSDHNLWSSLSNRLLPFGGRKESATTFVAPKGLVEVRVRPWSPSGKAFDADGARRPAGFPAAAGAASGFLETPWSKRVGRLEITGGMDAPTEKAFHAAFDGLRGLEALLIDGRGMGGGGDGPAWDMIGRLFARATPNGPHRSIEPTGAWNFDGPAVLLQDERMVSSAETFVWGLSEHERAISVGRPTGGWGIIPETFELPSGKAAFRLGVRDRPTPVKGVKTEGIGWPPDVLMPLGPVLAAEVDATASVGLSVLAALHAGAAPAATRRAFKALADGDLAAYRAFVSGLGAKAKGRGLESWADVFKRDLEGEVALEAAAAHSELPAEACGGQRRAARLLARAKASKLAREVAELERLQRALKPEAEAQAAWRALSDPFAPDAPTRAAWLAKHAKTRFARYVKDVLWAAR